MSDMASLGFRIDTTEVERATEALNDLAQAIRAVKDAMGALSSKPVEFKVDIINAMRQVDANGLAARRNRL